MQKFEVQHIATFFCLYIAFNGTSALERYTSAMKYVITLSKLGTQVKSPKTGHNTEVRNMDDTQ